MVSETLRDRSRRVSETDIYDMPHLQTLLADFVNMQYFIEIVPTEIMGFTGMKTTYQYSVKEHSRPIDHSTGSHGTPGIYFKYDLSALKVEVTKDRSD